LWQLLNLNPESRMKKKHNYHMVKDASRWQEMDGDSRAEKQINSYLTCAFISQYDIPSDECLNEAKAVLEEAGRSKEGLIDRIEEYIIHQFMCPESVVKRNCFEQAEEVMKLIGA